ncbi:MAG TPA: ABC transporter permease [Kribbella sp.]|nr:ABC transporter permease [Kribbella sp.]
MLPALTIAAKDLRRRLRDRSALVLGFVAPLGVAVLMSFAFSSVETFHADVALVDADRAAMAQAFHEVLASPELSDVLTVHPVADEQQARAQVDNGDVGAALVVPAGFTTAATGEQPLTIRVLGSPDNTIPAQVAGAIAEAFVAQINADRLSVHTALAAGVPPSRTAELAAAAAGLHLPERIVAAPTGYQQLKTVSYYAPAMGIFFLFFTIGFTARDYFVEERGGTLERIGAAPVGRGAVLLGKSLATFVYGVVSLGTLALVTALALDADWGPPLPAAAIIVALSTTLVALTALVVAVARTERQAEGLSSMITFGLVLLGGNFILISRAPETLRDLALATPNGWALRGFTDLATGAGAGAVVQPVLSILGTTVAVGLLAAVVLHRRAVR